MLPTCLTSISSYSMINDNQLFGETTGEFLLTATDSTDDQPQEFIDLTNISAKPHFLSMKQPMGEREQ